MVVTKRTLTLLFALVFTLCCTQAAFAHKEAAEAWTNSPRYYLSMGLVPAYVVEQEEQVFYLRPETINDNYVYGMRAEFMIFKNNATAAKEGRQLGAGWNDVLLATLESEEEVPGHYSVRYTFPKKGSYQVQGRLFDGEVMIGEITREIHVEPQGPSPQFWVYMLMMVLGGALIATKSDRLR